MGFFSHFKTSIGNAFHKIGKVIRHGYSTAKTGVTHLASTVWHGQLKAYNAGRQIFTTAFHNPKIIAPVFGPAGQIVSSAHDIPAAIQSVTNAATSILTPVAIGLAAVAAVIILR